MKTELNQMNQVTIVAALQCYIDQLEKDLKENPHASDQGCDHHALIAEAETTLRIFTS